MGTFDRVRNDDPLRGEIRDFLIPVLVTVMALGGCAAPTVNLSTAEPIKVDIAMRLDVFQHTKEAAKKPGQAPVAIDPESTRRNRMADVQQFKNSLLVGEGRDGLLVLRNDTPGDYGDYVRKTIAAENDDRMSLMKATADREKVPLPDVQRKQSELWQNRSFKNEWIEVKKPEGEWAWIQKE